MKEGVYVVDTAGKVAHVISHPVEHGEFPTRMMRCDHDLRGWRAGKKRLPGWCSVPCEYGVVFRTDDFPADAAEEIRKGNFA